MKGTLDSFFGTPQPKPKPTSESELTCSNPHCKKPINPKDTIFKFGKKGEEKVLCRECYKAKMRPREDNEESI